MTNMERFAAEFVRRGHTAESCEKVLQLLEVFDTLLPEGQDMVISLGEAMQHDQEHPGEHTADLMAERICRAASGQ